MALSAKDPAEKINVTFDYSSQFTSVNAAVPAPEVTVTVKGDSADIPAMKASSPIVLAAPNNNKVVISIQGGEANVEYDIRCTATTDTGEIIVVKDTFKVKNL